MEIERRFVLEEVPAVIQDLTIRAIYIVQDYLPISNPNHVVRLRRAGTKYFITIKKAVGLSLMVREEVEVSISEELYLKLKPCAEYGLDKWRYLVPWHDGQCLEIDVFNKGQLVVMECEFKSVAEAECFLLPDWASNAREVTEDKRYSNRSLARLGLPN